MKTITSELATVTGGAAFNWAVSKSDANYWGQMGMQPGAVIGGIAAAPINWAAGALAGGAIGYGIGAGASLAHDAVYGSGTRPIIGR